MTGASPQNAPSAEAPLLVDRYAIYDAIASGGMATVHLGRLIGTAGFLRTVAIKRLHAQFANDPEFTTMFLDEARLASRIQHPNVVSTLDVVMKDRELLLVMEYVRGESLSRLVRRARDAGNRLPPRVVVAIVAGALQGLHAAHEAVDEKGQPLGLVHRDMTPQNILVGTDGVARVLDFGVAKAAGRVHTTRDGDIKGKVLYMSPEQLSAQPLSRTADVYAAGVVLFEALTGVRMFAGDNEGAALTRIIKNELSMPSAVAPELAPFDDIVRRASAANPAHRYATALEMARALETVAGAGGAASHSEVSDWVQRLCGELLDERARIVSEIERSSTRSRPPLPFPSSGAMRADAAPGSGVSGVSQVSRVGTVTGVNGYSSASGIGAAPGVGIGVGAGGTGVTGMTGIAAVVMPQPARARSLPTIALVVMGLLVVVSVSVSVVLLRNANEKKAEVAATATPATAPSTAATAAAAAAPATGDSPNVSAPAVTRTPDAPASAASAEAKPATAAKPSGASSGATSVRRTGNVVAPSGGGRVVNCDPPYTIDKYGHQHFIPECLK